MKEFDVNLNKEALNVITEELIDVAKKIINARQKFIDEINKVINKIHKVFNEKEYIELIYSPNVKINDIDDMFKKHQESDIINKQTNTGPHRDDVIFLLNEKNLAKYGSQGQIRSVILSLKISLCEILYNVKGKYTILLLYDVLSELDPIRQNNLLKIANKFGQVFITTVDISVINENNLNNYQVIRL